MKKIYDVNGLKVYRFKIHGYECQLSEFKDGWCSVRVPYGESPEEIAMFDKLVYYNQKVYNGQNAKVIIYKVSEWIKNYKNENKKRG